MKGPSNGMMRSPEVPELDRTEKWIFSMAGLAVLIGIATTVLILKSALDRPDHGRCLASHGEQRMVVTGSFQAGSSWHPVFGMRTFDACDAWEFPEGRPRGATRG